MPLLALWKSNADAVNELSIEQIVSTAGQGTLSDGSECSAELRSYLAEITTAKLADYVERCLTASFPRSGMVLQDLVNELGRRLDYSVANGRYQGTTNAVGYDGLWRSPEGHTVVAEVKTTDAYRISLDTIVAYRERLKASGEITGPASILIIVGREDTGELEAQVRGSRHAWDIRLISADALIKLVRLKESSEAQETGLKIRSLLTPMEYTRLDRMVDVMFTTVSDVEQSVTEAVEVRLSSSDAGEDDEPRRREGKGVWQFTSSEDLQAKRERVIAALAEREKAPLIRKTRALYWNSAQNVRAACAISKRYTNRGSYPYWYAYHQPWDEFLAEAERGYYLLGCMDLDVAYAIPQRILKPLLPELNSTVREGQEYRHVHLTERSGEMALLLPRKSDVFSLKPYELPLATVSHCV